MHVTQDTTTLIAAFAIGIVTGAALGAGGMLLAKRTPKDREKLLRKAQDYNIRALRVHA